MIYNNDNINNLPVAIIGGGPVGLSAASHLVSRNQPFILFESGEQVGTNFLDYGHVRLFSPWEYNIDPASKKLLIENGWNEPVPKRLPYASDIFYEYIKPLSEHPDLKPHIHLKSEVIAIGRNNKDKRKSTNRNKTPFILHVESSGKRESFLAKAVIDASGTWQQQNPIGAGGIYARGEKESSKHIFYGIPDVLNKHEERYIGKKTLVVGSGYSAVNTLINLSELKRKNPNTTIVWVLRKKEVSETFSTPKDKILGRYKLEENIEQLVSKGYIEVHTPFYINEVRQKNNKVNVLGKLGKEEQIITNVDEIISTTGSRPNFKFLREIRFDRDPAIECAPKLVDIINPQKGIVPPHGEERLRQPEEGFYIIGAKSFGRASTFFLTTGYEQARSVVSYLSEDITSSHQTKITLPSFWYENE